MIEQGFRGNCDSQGKLGMCPSLAEPDLSDFPKSNVSNHQPQTKKLASIPMKTAAMKYYKVTLRENGLQRPAKGGSTPAFACQRAAIAPLPCPNLQLVS